MCVSVSACVRARARAREDGKWKGVREERGTRVQRTGRGKGTTGAGGCWERCLNKAVLLYQSPAGSLKNLQSLFKCWNERLLTPLVLALICSSDSVKGEHVV